MAKFFRDFAQQQYFLQRVVAFASAFSALMWCVPCLSLRWNMMNWYIAAGMVARIKLEFGLFNYNIDVDCNRVLTDSKTLASGKLKLLGDLCSQEVNDPTPQLGTHRYSELTSYMCNVKASAGKLLLFSGCDQVQTLKWTSNLTGMAIVVGVGMILIASGMLYLYMKGHGQKRLVLTVRGLYVLGVFVQFLALAFYGFQTCDMQRYFNVGLLLRLPFAQFVFGTAQNFLVSFGLSYVFAWACVGLSGLGAVAALYVERPDALADPLSDDSAALQRYYSQCSHYGAADAASWPSSRPCSPPVSPPVSPAAGHYAGPYGPVSPAVSPAAGHYAGHYPNMANASAHQHSLSPPVTPPIMHPGQTWRSPSPTP